MTSTEPGHEARRVARQVDDRGPELLGQRVALHRRVVDPARLELRVVDRRHLGLDVARRERVDAHAVRRPLRGQRLGELVDRRLGGVVGRLPLRPVDDLGRDRADVHDRAGPALDHLPPDRAGAAPQAVDVDVPHRAPLLLRHLERRAVEAGAGVVDEHVDGPELGRDRLEHARRRSRASVMSVVTASAPSSPATASERAASRAAIATRAPASPSARASAIPIPRLPPVTTATLSSSRNESRTVMALDYLRGSYASRPGETQPGSRTRTGPRARRGSGPSRWCGCQRAGRW